jgi:hypothetical protein
LKRVRCVVLDAIISAQLTKEKKLNRKN